MVAAFLSIARHSTGRNILSVAIWVGISMVDTSSIINSWSATDGINGTVLLGGAGRAVHSSIATVSTFCDSWSSQQYADVSVQLNASLQSPLTWWAGLSGQTPIFVNNTGVSGQRSDQWFARLPAILADLSKWVYVTTPVNDIGQAFAGYTVAGGPLAGTAVTLTNVNAVLQANFTSIIQQIIKAGKTPIVLTCVGAATNYNSTQITARNTYNAWLTPYLAATNSVQLDARNIVTNGNLSTVTWLAGYNIAPGGTPDGVHPSNIGSYYLGKALWQTPAFSVMAARNLLPISTASAQAFGTQILLNNLFQTLTGGTNTGFTGDAPSSWTSYVASGTASGVNSHAAGAVGNDLTATVTYSGTTTAETRIYQLPASGFPVTGNKLRAAIQYDVAANSSALLGVQTQASYTLGGLTTGSIDGYAQVSGAGPLPAEAFTYTALTPATLVVPVGTVTAAQFSVRQEYSGASGGSGVVKMRQAGLFVN